MPRVLRLELISVDLPFRHAFRHAAAARKSSESLFLKCVTDTGAVGFGESLPREYITGETRDAAFALLQTSILPNLVGMEFNSLEEVREFLVACDGKAPSDWVARNVPQSAAWCAVDLALLDAFGRACREPVRLTDATPQINAFRYSAVVSAGTGRKFLFSLLKLKLYGFRHVKLKVGEHDVQRCARMARRVMGKQSVLRVDANMAWNVSEAEKNIRTLERASVCAVEQPVDADDFEGLATLARQTEMEIIADESFSDRESLERLLEQRAGTGVNVRISKCGGLIAAARRCEEALRAGFTVQIGCQVGESSLLSAAQLILISAAREAKYFEGCYGKHLLCADPVHPCLQLGYGGRPPRLPDDVGLRVQLNEAELSRWVNKRVVVGERSMKREEKLCHS